MNIRKFQRSKGQQFIDPTKYVVFIDGILHFEKLDGSIIRANDLQRSSLTLEFALKSVEKGVWEEVFPVIRVFEYIPKYEGDTSYFKYVVYTDGIGALHLRDGTIMSKEKCCGIVDLKQALEYVKDGAWREVKPEPRDKQIVIKNLTKSEALRIAIEVKKIVKDLVVTSDE